MQLSGQKTFNTGNAVIWNLLMNPDSLSRIIPGVTNLVKTAENIYKSVVEIKIGPVSGFFEGTVELSEIAENSSFQLNARQSSKIGNANAIVNFSLFSGNNSETNLSFEGDVKLTGLLASMGQRVLSGVSNTLIKQFFSNMDVEIQKQSAA